MVNPWLQRWSRQAVFSDSVARIRPTRGLLCLLLTLGLFACAGTAARTALAAGTEGSSLQQLAEEEALAEKSKTATTATTSSSTSTEGTGNSHTVLVLAMVAAVVLLSGIAFVIVRDARRVAPATEADITEPRSSRDTAAMLRKRRAKAKAARQQRKRNR